ncbi:hypothetical protein NQ318_011916 [Aromia moschata]|uniref:Peptidylamidoglycolate lyase n=1 Tax=Aromia moschata TaxID=1265417 RepID=A0AAV8X597_9CUCU|nr:hypothetical protein NQ318_011916 [Aromia moschata]
MGADFWWTLFKYVYSETSSKAHQWPTQLDAAKAIKKNRNGSSAPAFQSAASTPAVLRVYVHSVRPSQNALRSAGSIMNIKRTYLIAACTISVFILIIIITVVTTKHNAQSEPTVEDPADKPDVPRAVKNWPREPLNLGQVSGVSVNSALQPHIQHLRLLSASSPGPDQKDHTVLTLDPQDGKILGRWGAELFYLPHGLTFKPGELQPALTFGQRFEPGSDTRHLCMPTSVAVATTGEIFIADGYCNSRILKYNAAGVLLRVIPSPTEFLNLQVPHSLALIEPTDRLCVADRENKRVTCPRAGLYTIQGKKEPALTIQQPDMGRVFAVAAKGKLVYAVNGPTSPLLQVQGFTIDPQTESIIDHWAPSEGFGNPHDIAVCPNGSALYVVEIGPNRVWKFELVPPKRK